jgi:hypothetical protein
LELPGSTSNCAALGIHPSLHKILQPNPFIASPTKVVVTSTKHRVGPKQGMNNSEKNENGTRKGFLRAFLDFFVLFSGISTRSNLERTQRRPLLSRGLFLFRSKKGKGDPSL